MSIKQVSYFKYLRLISVIYICILLIASACMKDIRSDDQTNINETNNSFGDTSLHIAAQNGDLERVNQLCSDPRVDVNAKNRYDETPLHLAAERGDLQVVRSLFLRRDLNVNNTNYFGKTALDIALKNGNEAIVALLQSVGAVSGQ